MFTPNVQDMQRIPTLGLLYFIFHTEGVCCVLCFSPLVYHLLCVGVVSSVWHINQPDSWKQASHSTEFYTELKNCLSTLFLHPNQAGFELKFDYLRIKMLR